MAKKTTTRDQFIQNYSQEVKELDTNSLKNSITKSQDYLKNPLVIICFLYLSLFYVQLLQSL